MAKLEIAASIKARRAKKSQGQFIYKTVKGLNLGESMFLINRSSSLEDLRRTVAGCDGSFGNLRGSHLHSQY